MKRELEKCPECREDFPEELFWPLSIIDKGRTETLRACPICAREIMNNVHGLPEDTPFLGELANDLYDKAVRWRKGKRK